jgi:hypothetical protein
MKNHIRALLIFAIFMFCFVVLAAQRNTVYLSFSLPDRGLGLRYERNFITEPQTNSIGLYLGATKGKYPTWYNRALKHTKINSGLVYYFHPPEAKYTNIFCAGLNYNFYSRLPELDRSVYFPVSFDIGTGMRIKKVNVLMTYDLLKKDASINLGYNF